MTPVPALVDGAPGSADPFDRELEVEQRLSRISSGVLDRESRHTGPGGGRHVGRYTGRLDREAAFEVGVHRYIHCCRDAAHVGQRLIHGDLVVALSE
jgi:hypothetical protein